MAGRPRPVSIETKPYPGFPTDLQAPWMSWMCRAKGRARVQETVFENRFLHVMELSRMGARVHVEGHAAVIDGVPKLQGAQIMASDIRAGAALLVAGLSAEGRTALQRVYHVDRGYEKVESKLRGAGARVRRVRA
jgi:UDP-N-acetylglucosamine 1-carboxyvinyltransferase